MDYILNFHNLSVCKQKEGGWMGDDIHLEKINIPHFRMTYQYKRAFGSTSLFFKWGNRNQKVLVNFLKP